MLSTTIVFLLFLFLLQFPPIPAQDSKCDDPAQCAGSPREVACINGLCAPRSPVGGPCDRVGSLSGIPDCQDKAPDGAQLECLRDVCVRTKVVPLGGACKDPVQCEGEPSEIACINGECAPRSPVGGPCDRVGSLSGIPDCQANAPDGAELECLRGACVRTNVVPLGGACKDPKQCEGEPFEIACINDKCAPRSGVGGPCDLVGSIGGYSDCLKEVDGVELICISGECVKKGIVPVPSRTPGPRESSPPRSSPPVGPGESRQPVKTPSVNPSRTPQAGSIASGEGGDRTEGDGEGDDSNLKIILPSVIGGLFAIAAAVAGAWVAKGRKKDSTSNPDINVTTQQNTIIQVSTTGATEQLHQGQAAGP